MEFIFPPVRKDFLVNCRARPHFVEIFSIYTFSVPWFVVRVVQTSLTIMAAPNVVGKRVEKEWVKYQKERPPGITYWPVSDKMDHFEGTISGPDDSPYAGGTFKLDISIPTRYPFEPPFVKFKTPVYHPNIDSDGRICLDILKMPPAGAWKPQYTISQVLMHLQVLMNEPNPADPLMVDIAKEYMSDRESFMMNAKAQTQKHATYKRPAEEVENEHPSQKKSKAE